MINEEIMMAIWNSVELEQDKWCARKFIINMDKHKKLYPAFKEDRVAEIFIKSELKYKKRYAYEPIKNFTKSIHKANSLRSLANSQS